MPDHGHLIVTDDDATRIITMRRPQKKNAITQSMYVAMSNATPRMINRTTSTRLVARWQYK